MGFDVGSGICAGFLSPWQVGVTLWGCPALVGAELGAVAALGGIVGM